MPALPSLLKTLDIRNAAATNSSSSTVQVVCAWPLSGQYGPGSRSLYYVLVAACVFARKSPWLRKACLAAALLFPAVAALHGIVLAAVHVDGVIDMDVYGALQLCAIGILAAPVTARQSTTYFNDPGRDTIFVWTGLLLGGLLSLVIEFFRTSTSPCAHDDSGNIIPHNPADFPYGTLCGLPCFIGRGGPDPSISGPESPLRGGSANNIYVIPAPTKLTFDTALLLAAACCIPAILSLISMWNKIIVTNWKARFGNNNNGEQNYMPISDWIQKLLTRVEIPVFGAAVIAILIIGELNFSSFQVKYQTEPMASIGQWAPVVGTALGIIGSLYLLLRAELSVDGKEEEQSSSTVQTNNLQRSSTVATVKTRKVARSIGTFFDKLSTAEPESFEFSDAARHYPETPGEAHRSPDFHHNVEQYKALRQQPSRAASFNGSIASRPSIEDSPTMPRATSPQPPRSRSPSPFSSPARPQRPHASTFPVDRGPPEQRNPGSSASAGPIRTTARERRDTLEVPSPVRLHHTRNSLSISSVNSADTVRGWRDPPAIVFSEPDAVVPTGTPPSDPPTPPSPMNPPQRPPNASLHLST